MSTSTSVHSNAFNFMSFILNQVDPRTGQYTCAISLPELKANNLCGPVVPLQLNFNPLNAPDSGFGKGWNLQLSQFNTANSVLSLYTGETFKVNPIGLTDETGHMGGFAKLFAVLMNGVDAASGAGAGSSAVARGGRSATTAARGVGTSAGAAPIELMRADELLSGWTMSNGIEAVTFGSKGHAGQMVRPTSGASGSSRQAAALPSTSTSRFSGAAAPARIEAPQAAMTKTAPKAPKAQPVPKARPVPKPLTKEQFNNMSSIQRNDYLARGGEDPVRRRFQTPAKKSVFDVKVVRDRFND